MRSLAIKVLAIVAMTAMFFSVSASIADAQDYPSRPPVNVVASATCSTVAAPGISFDGTDVVTTVPADPCIVRVTVEVNPTLYDGPRPASGLLRLAVPALSGDEHTATATVYSLSGAKATATAKISPALLAEARAKFAAAGGSIPATPAVAVPNLAFTGSSASTPVAVGAGLVGLGGLVLLAARKREHAAS